MHYFHIGNDDRTFLNKIYFNIKKHNINVQNKNLTLKETIDLYNNAYFNIGMRFHAVIFQTIGSGRNYILDYTEPSKGKITGFIKDIDKTKFYSSRYISLQDENLDINIIRNTEDEFFYDAQDVKNSLLIYTTKLKELSI